MWNYVAGNDSILWVISCYTMLNYVVYQKLEHNGAIRLPLRWCYGGISYNVLLGSLLSNKV
jgi:hypothetical protein